MSLSKSKLKYLRSLKLKKFRQKYDNFVVEGDKIVGELLQSNSLEIEGIFATKKWIDSNSHLLYTYTSITHVASEPDLKTITLFNTPSQVYVIVKRSKQALPNDFLTNHFALYLDDIQDPGNLGTILRIADWFGISTVICSEKCVDIYNHKVIQSSMGAFLRVNILNASFGKIYKQYPDVPYYGTVLAGNNLYEEKFLQKGIVVIGNEGRGISDEILDKLTHRIFIPKGKNGGAESLNAAVATGIVCSVLSQNQ